MKMAFSNIYPAGVIARYLLSSYILKAYLDNNYNGGENLTVEVLNFSEKVDIEKACDKLMEANADIIGHSCYVWNMEKTLKVIKRIRERKNNIVHIMGGPEITYGRIESLPDPFIADYYVIGEGERKLLRLIKYLENRRNGREDTPPKSIIYSENGRLNYFRDNQTIENLDEIPSVYLTQTIESRLYEKQQAFIETMRGCRYRCKYCVYHKSNPSCAYYSLERVFAELDYLIIKKQITALRFLDPVFTADIERAKKIVRYLSALKNKRGIKLPWIYWEFTHNAVDEEFFKLTASLKNYANILNCNKLSAVDRPQHYSDMLADYNVINCIGVQSFLKDALRAVGRFVVKKDELDFFLEKAKEYNIVLKLDLILGLPFETFDSYFEGLEFFLPYFENTDHVLNIHRLQILPGSELESLCDEYKIVYSTQAPHFVHSTNTMSEQELNYAAKLTAVLFRILNSPLRKLFFAAKAGAEISFYELVKNIYNEVSSHNVLKSARVVRDEVVDDEYWNDVIFWEVPTRFLVDSLESYSSVKS
jgi:radical SAM superfamily enzyme YgiQ (UPF0313 family)